jgi:PAS domain S-box-containing protein
MRLRIIVLVLSLLAFLSTATGGYFYYFSLKESAIVDARKESAARARAVRNRFSAFLHEQQKPVSALAGLEEMQQALLHTDERSLIEANLILDHFNNALGTDVCYLMNKDGVTVASSNRAASDSFVGKKFAFRPYFQKAIVGVPTIYMALGSASGKRGVYYSHPVQERGTAHNPIGVVVIKASIAPIEKELTGEHKELVLLTDPHGIVFVSTRKKWLFHSLWRLTSEEAAAVAASRQFGTGPYPWTGLTMEANHRATDRSRNAYLSYTMPIGSFPGWNVMYLQDLDAVYKRLADPLLSVTGYLVVALCMLVGLSAGILYGKASSDIERRKAAEKGLRIAKEELSRYSEDLERQVAERTKEITGILMNTPCVVFLKDTRNRYILVNSRFEQLFGVPEGKVLGKTDRDIFPVEVADQLKTNDDRVLAEHEAIQVEETVHNKDGSPRTYLTVKFPLLDEEGAVRSICGIATDITAIKKAQDELRRLSGSIMAGQEKERAALARELHDELGQMLTAMRMDAVWLRERLERTDQQASERAADICNLVDETIDDVRGIAVRLRPGALDDLGLVPALEWYINDFEKRTGITCLFGHTDIPGVNTHTSIAVYRIAQEALTNVVRHADSPQVSITLQAKGAILELLVVDEGRGFDIHEIEDSGGLGLAGMRERAALVSGSVRIESRPGMGTRVRLSVPLDTAGGVAQ